MTFQLFSTDICPSNYWTYVQKKNGEYIRFTNEMLAFEYCNENNCRILEDFEIKDLLNELKQKIDN